MTEKPKWKFTAVQNLIRYEPSGTYFARFKIRGKLICKSLKTRVFSVAKLRLPDMLRDYRSRAELAATAVTGKMRVEGAVEIYRAKTRADLSLKPRSKEYRETLVGFIRRSWPALFALDVQKVTDRDCREWLSQYEQRYAPSVVNNSIGTLRAIFQEAVNAGARYSNPAAQLSRLKVRTRRPQLPSRDEFARLVKEIATAGARQSHDCANLVKLLAYSGMRIGEAKHLTWSDVDFVRAELHVRGDPQLGTKNGDTRFVPMIPELKELLLKLRMDRPKELATARVMRVSECRISMAHAADKIGVVRPTHHNLRHLFATVCIESGVDIPTVSRWLGHKDGGALCMRTYGHLRDEHSFAQAQRVSFRREATTSNPTAAQGTGT